MNEKTENMIVWVIIIFSSIIAAVLLWEWIKNSPAAKVLSDLMDTINGVLTALNKMLQSCMQGGWANPKSCPLGFAGILIGSVLGLLWLVTKVRSLYKDFAGEPTGSTGKSCEKLAAITGENGFDIQLEECSKINIEKFNEAVEKYGIDKAISMAKIGLFNNLIKRAELEAQKNESSAESVKEFTTTTKTNYVNPEYDDSEDAPSQEVQDENSGALFDEA